MIRPFRFHIKTFGCQMNVHDSVRMEGVLCAAGGAAVDALEDADVIVVNTCSVREKAEQKLRSLVGTLAPLKQARPDVVIAVAGCLAQQEGDKLIERLRHVDLIVGPDNLEELPALLAEQMAGAPPIARTEFDTAAPRFLAWSPSPEGEAEAPRGPIVGFVTTMKGCDERCSFCIVPYTRGPERYRPAREIVDEVARFVRAGAREVLLLGQTVDSFQDPSLPPPEADAEIAVDRGRRAGDETQFPHLLRLIADSAPAGLARLRYTSPHPRHATAALARAHAEIDVLARHVHLPVQSGSDRVLRRMIRRYTRAEYVARARRLMRARPGLTLSTDVIVGFPGETEEDFRETLSLVGEMGFVSLFGFKYSPRPYTPALRLGDDVPEDVKSERLTRLFEAAESIAAAYLAALVGTRQQVLVEGPSKSEKSGAARGLVQGRTDANAIVHVESGDGASLVGQVVEVDVVRANRHSVVGALREVHRAPARAGRRTLPVVTA
ncbi:MAG TPA: tRNA (N6-isopentenyl adenosine(37)-C2)-methylthiotransferase MiaB [Polyangiaceae bacterium]|jgi:tRNA-2-methylthio-N6-dimethylallyladenosine synthase